MQKLVHVHVPRDTQRLFFLILLQNLIELNGKQFFAIKLNYKFGFAPIQLLAATSIHVIHFQNNAIGLFYGLSTLRGVHNVRT